MAVNEQPAPGPLTETKDGLTVTREFNIDATSKVEARSLLRAAGIRIGVTYRDALDQVPDPFVKAVSIAITPLGRELVARPAIGVFEAVVTYESDLFGSVEEGFELTPDGPAIFKSSASLENKPIDVDLLGFPLANSAGVPFDPPETIPFPSEFLTAEFIKSNTKFDDALQLARKFRGKLNSSEFKGAFPLEVLCHNVLPTALDFDAFSSGGLIKFNVRFEFRGSRILKSGGENVSVPGFQTVRVDKGRLERNPNFDANDPTSKRLRPITVKVEEDGMFVQVSDDVLLDGSGLEQKPAVNVFLQRNDVIERADLNEIFT